jgi:hypothetical protein
MHNTTAKMQQKLALNSLKLVFTRRFFFDFF